MKKIYLLLVFLFIGIIYACHKDNRAEITITENKNNSPITLTIKDAKEYMAASTNYQQINTTFITNSVKQTSDNPAINNRSGVVMWSKAAVYRNNRYEVIESPILFNKKIVRYYKLPGESKTESDSIVTQASFSRIAIFRDTTTKKISKKIITYIPDRKSVIASNYDISGNYLNHFNSNFSGYVEFQEWDGTGIVVYRINNGRRIAKYHVTLLSTNPNAKNVNAISDKVKVTGTVCDSYEYEWDEVISMTAESGIPYDSLVIHHDDWITFCYDDGSGNFPPDPGPTPDPGDDGNNGDGSNPVPPKTPEKDVVTEKTITVDQPTYIDNDLGVDDPNTVGSASSFVPIQYVYHVTIHSGEETGIVTSVIIDPVTVHPGNITYYNPDGGWGNQEYYFISGLQFIFDWSSRGNSFMEL